MRRMLRKIISEQRGATVLIVTLVLVVLLGFAALVVDFGLLFEQRRQLQNAVDAAALAGADMIAIDVTQARPTAYSYAAANGVPSSEVTEVRIITVFNGGDGMRVSARRQVNLLFAPVLGRFFGTVDATATAILTQIENKKIWPWGITGESLAASAGGPVTLKVGSPNSMIGNFMALALGGTGANVYEDNIKYGYYGPVPDASESNPWIVDTQTGNMVGPTLQGVSWVVNQPYNGPINDVRNPRVGLVPILSADTWDEVTGHSEVAVVGFAVFYLNDAGEFVPAGSGGGGSGGGGGGGAGQAEVTGNFMAFAHGVGNSQNIGGALEGLVGARLWE